MNLIVVLVLSFIAGSMLTAAALGLYLHRTFRGTALDEATDDALALGTGYLAIRRRGKVRLYTERLDPATVVVTEHPVLRGGGRR